MIEAHVAYEYTVHTEGDVFLSKAWTAATWPLMPMSINGENVGLGPAVLVVVVVLVVDDGVLERVGVLLSRRANHKETTTASTSTI